MRKADLLVFFDRFPDPCLLISAQGTVERANTAFAALTGTAVMPDAALDTLMPEADRPLCAAAMARIATGETDASFRAGVIGADGPFLWQLSRSRSGCRVTLTPATASPQASPDGERLRATLAALPDLLMEFDRDGRFLAFHTPPTMRLAIAPEDFLGRLIEEVLPPEVASVGRRAMAEIDLTGRSSGLRYPLGDAATGGEAWFEISGAARNDAAGGYLFLLREVTEQVRRAAAVDYHAALQRTLHDLSPIGITLTDAVSRTLLDANPAFLQMSGYARDALIGQTVDIILSPDVSEARSIARMQLAETGRFGPVEMDCVRQDGSRFPARLSGASMVAPPHGPNAGRQLLWTLIEDVTDEHARRDRLRQAEQFAVTARQQLLGAVEGLADGFVLYDADDRLVMVNSAYRHIYSEDEAISHPGSRFADIIRHCIRRGDYADAAGREEEFFAERMAQHRSASQSFEQRLTDGRIVRIEERALPDGGRVGLHVQVTDLHRARQAAEQASQTKSTFLAHMGHEIRTPLAGILGMTELLMDRLDRPEQLSLARAVHQSGETLLTILNDLLDMSKIEAGKLDLEDVAFDPAELARGVSALYELRADGKGLHYALEIAPDVQGQRKGDPHRIAQILHNLLSNALKFTRIGGLTLGLQSGTAGELILSVRDSGIGMSQDQVGRMLKPFEQAEAQTTRRYGGTGLGMSIVARLVEMMGGRMQVTSMLGAGTLVEVILPLPVVDDGAKAGPGRATPVDAERLRGMRVLAADDNEINRHMLQAYLERLGVIVTMVDDGTEALDQWQPGAFDLICLDISMPGLDGPTALQMLRAKAMALGVTLPPAVAVTSNAMTHQIADYMAAGFAAHLGKPFRKDDLIRVLGGFVPAAPPGRAMGVPAA